MILVCRCYKNATCIFSVSTATYKCQKSYKNKVAFLIYYVIILNILIYLTFKQIITLISTSDMVQPRSRQMLCSFHSP